MKPEGQCRANIIERRKETKCGQRRDFPLNVVIICPVMHNNIRHHESPLQNSSKQLVVGYITGCVASPVNSISQKRKIREKNIHMHVCGDTQKYTHLHELIHSARITKAISLASTCHNITTTGNNSGWGRRGHAKTRCLSELARRQEAKSAVASVDTQVHETSLCGFIGVPDEESFVGRVGGLTGVQPWKLKRSRRGGRRTIISFITLHVIPSVPQIKNSLFREREYLQYYLEAPSLRHY